MHYSSKRVASLLLTIACIIAAGFASYALLANASPSRGGVSPNTLPPQPTPTVRPAEHPGLADAMTAIRNISPNVAKAIAAAETSDIDALFSTMKWIDATCLKVGERGMAPACADLGLPNGANVRLFHYELHENSYFSQQTMRARLSTLLKVQNPSFALFAVRPDGTGRLSFTLDDASKQGIRGLDFIIDGSTDTPLVSFTERFAAATPLDTIREEESRAGKSRSKIVYVSPKLQAWEQEKDAARRNPQPGPGVTPSVR